MLNVNMPLSADDDFNLWIFLQQAHDTLSRAREKELSQYGMTLRESACLFSILAIGDNVTPAKISRMMFREHHTVSGLLSRMERKGLIKRKKDPRMKNVWRVSLTKKGQNTYHQSIKRESIHKVMSPLAEDERQQLRSYLERIRDEALKQLALAGRSRIPFP